MTVQQYLDGIEEGVSYDITIEGRDVKYRIIGNSEIWTHAVYKGVGTQIEFDDICSREIIKLWDFDETIPYLDGGKIEIDNVYKDMLEVIHDVYLGI